MQRHQWKYHLYNNLPWLCVARVRVSIIIIVVSGGGLECGQKRVLTKRINPTKQEQQRWRHRHHRHQHQRENEITCGSRAFAGSIIGPREQEEVVNAVAVVAGSGVLYCWCCQVNRQQNAADLVFYNQLFDAVLLVWRLVSVPIEFLFDSGRKLDNKGERESLVYLFFLIGP